MTSPRLVGVTVGDRPAAWASLGFEVAGDRFTVGGVTVHLAGDTGGRGVLGWSLEPSSEGDIDGLLSVPTPPPAAPVSHRNGVTGVDHVVVGTPDVDRTTTAMEQHGIALRRAVDGLRGGDKAYRFFLLGTCLLEVIGPAAHDPDRTPRPAAFVGLAFVADDLEAAAALPDVAGEPRDAIQAGRRIVTLRTAEHDVSVPLAILTPRVRGR
jgi:hypothetical protein